MDEPFVLFQTWMPTAALRPFVSHYWLSRSNAAATHVVLPDGAVDAVIEVGAGNCQTRLFGTSTRKTEVPLSAGSDYLGIRFRPGQSRHFLDVAATVLTDAALPGEGAPFLKADDIAEWICGRSGSDLIARLDALLLAQLARRAAEPTRLDDLIRHMEMTPEPLKVADLADQYGRSRRQFERRFLGAVGVPAKLFIEIVRFRRTLTRLGDSGQPLALIAAELGYADQSHMTNRFTRFCGMPPSRARRDVAFLQEIGVAGAENGGSQS